MPNVGRRIRVVDKAQLVECSIVSFPCFEQTSAQIETARLALQKAHLNRTRSLGGIQ
jgi:phage head maturation protease